MNDDDIEELDKLVMELEKLPIVQLIEVLRQFQRLKELARRLGNCD